MSGSRIALPRFRDDTANAKFPWPNLPTVCQLAPNFFQPGNPRSRLKIPRCALKNPRCKIGCFHPTCLGGRIMPSMTQALGPAHWTGNPSLSQLWLGSTLRTLAMLVMNVAIFLKLIPSRPARECHAEPTPADLPDAKRDTIRGTTTTLTTTILAALLSQSHEGLTLRTIARSAIVDSKGEAVLTAARHAHRATGAKPLTLQGGGAAGAEVQRGKSGGGRSRHAPQRATPT